MGPLGNLVALLLGHTQANIDDQQAVIEAEEIPQVAKFIRQNGLHAAAQSAQLTRQVTTAVGDATTAAIAVSKYLDQLKTGKGVG